MDCSGLTDADDKKNIEDVKASLEGDGHAYRRLVVRYQNTVATQMRRFSRDAGVLEELVQEVFVQAYRSLKSYNGDSTRDVTAIHNIKPWEGEARWYSFIFTGLD